MGEKVSLWEKLVHKFKVVSCDLVHGHIGVGRTGSCSPWDNRNEGQKSRRWMTSSPGVKGCTQPVQREPESGADLQPEVPTPEDFRSISGLRYFHSYSLFAVGAMRLHREDRLAWFFCGLQKSAPQCHHVFPAWWEHHTVSYRSWGGRSFNLGRRRKLRFGWYKTEEQKCGTASFSTVV